MSFYFVLVIANSLCVGVCFNLTYYTTLWRARLGIIIHYTEWVGHESLITSDVRCLGDHGRRKNFPWLFALEDIFSFEHSFHCRKSLLDSLGFAAETIRKKQNAITNIRTNGSYISAAAAVDAPFNDQKNGICSVPILRHSTHSRGHSYEHGIVWV